MRLYLVQHGEAMSKADDPERPLTEQGREDVVRVGSFARSAGIKVHQIRHSGIGRAEETATILATHLRPDDGVVALMGLAPKDDVVRVAELLKRETRSLMLVGHRPFMDRLVGLLVADDPERAVVRFEKGGIVCLEKEPPTWTWTILWVVTPELVPQEAAQNP